MLYNSDKAELLTPNMWLNDRIINAAQFLMKKQFPNTQGLHDTVTLGGGSEMLTAGTQIVQIVHDAAKEHWLTVSTIGCPDDCVNVYCSLQKVPSDRCVKTITSFLKFAKKNITLRVCNVAKQRGGNDCGLYAIAYAVTLLNGKDPVNMAYDQKKMRNHLTTCLNNGLITESPSMCRRTVRTEYCLSALVPLYCKCNTSYVTDDSMIECGQCKDWYHIGCVGLTDELFMEFDSDNSKKYLCDKCT